MTSHGPWRAISQSLATRSRKWREIGDTDRVLWLQILLLGDSHGMLDGDATKIWVECTRGLGWNLEKTTRSLRNLADARLIQQWVCADGLDWVRIVDYDDHQPREFIRKRAQARAIAPPFDPDSGACPEAGRPQKIEPRKKKEEERDRSANQPAADRLSVFEHWKQAFKKTNATVLDEKRKRRIDWAVKTYGLERALQSVSGYARDPWEGRKRNHDITLLFRDAAHFERGLELFGGAPGAGQPSLVRPAR